MASESVTMLPCPFCGETPPLPEGLGTQYEIECHCGCARAAVQICDLMTLAERSTGWDEAEMCYRPEFVERAKAAAIAQWNTRVPSAEAKADGSIVLSPEGQQILGRAIGSHGAVVQYLTMGRSDLALAESRQWVEGVSLAADAIRAQDAAIAQQGAAAAQEVGRG